MSGPRSTADSRARRRTGRRAASSRSPGSATISRGGAQPQRRRMPTSSSSPAPTVAYDLRHSFASLLMHEGRLSIVELAEQMGHNPTMCLSTYAHVMAELRHRRSARRIRSRAARAVVNESGESGPGPNPAQEQIPGQLNFEDLALGGRADGGTRTPDPFITSEVLYQLSYVGAASEG